MSAFLYLAYIIKTWSQPACSFHCIKALALPEMSKRATLKAPRRCIYIVHPAIHYIYKVTWHHLYNDGRMYLIETSKGAFPLLCFWHFDNEFARFLYSQNQSVQLRLLYVCVSPPLSPQGFQRVVNSCKYNYFFLTKQYFSLFFLQNHLNCARYRVNL